MQCPSNSSSACMRGRPGKHVDPAKPERPLLVPWLHGDFLCISISIGRTCLPRMLTSLLSCCFLDAGGLPAGLATYLSLWLARFLSGLYDSLRFRPVFFVEAVSFPVPLKKLVRHFRYFFMQIVHEVLLPDNQAKFIIRSFFTFIPQYRANRNIALFTHERGEKPLSSVAAP